MFFAAPAWLFGLLLVPVIWYLHRSGPVLRRHEVASVELWREATHAAPQTGARRRADPAWLRRAAIAALLSLVLAGPTLPGPAPRVTVWVDDSLSMLTEESGETRLERGLRDAETALSRDGTVDVEVRTLSRPWQSRAGLDDATRRGIEAVAGGSEPEVPDPRHLDPARAHWLVTDGADPAVNAWLATTPVSRVFQVGRVAHNVGITRLVARPQPTDPHARAVQVRVLNGGERQESRRVEIAAGSTLLDARTLTLEPGSAATVEISTRVDAPAVTARLVPADALARDDTAEVRLETIAPVAVRVDTTCPPAMRRALAAHPSLRAARGGDAELVVDCGGGEPGDANLPRVHLTDGAPAALESQSLLSSARAGFAAAALRIAPTLGVRGRIAAPGPADIVLVETAAEPIVVLRPGPPRIVDTSLDLSSAEIAGDPAVPLLVEWLVDTALGVSLLDRTAGTDRGDAASRVAALGRLQNHATATASTPGNTSPFLLPALWLVLALLAWDVASLARRARQERRAASVSA